MSRVNRDCIRYNVSLPPDASKRLVELSSEISKALNRTFTKSDVIEALLSIPSFSTAYDYCLYHSSHRDD